jgi:hypothetical protein
MEGLTSVINHLVMITIFVFVMMLIVDYINVLTKGDIAKALKGGEADNTLLHLFSARARLLRRICEYVFLCPLGFRRFCQGKHDTDITDLRACETNI